MGPRGMGGPPMGGHRMGGPPPGRPPHEQMPFSGKHQPKPPEDDFIEQEFDLEQMERESEEMVALHPLKEENAQFRRTSGGSLTLRYAGKEYAQVDLVKTFPLTAPFSYISVRNPQERNKEIGCIVDLEADFHADTAAMIKEQLELRYHMPVIEKIVQVKESGNYSNFTVLTDCGEAQFSLRSNSFHITQLNENRLIIQDLENNRFEIPDKRRLSAKEMKKLDIFM